jgi:hypothetical protein
MTINKIQLNDDQVDLAKQWLPNGSYPYAYNIKGMLWFRDHLGHKNAIKLSADQIQQLNQFN